MVWQTGRRELFSLGSDAVVEQDSLGNHRLLTDDDYDYELELDFPPDGSAGKDRHGNPELPLYATPPHKLAKSFKFKVSLLMMHDAHHLTPPHAQDYMANVFHAIRSQSGIDEAEYMLSIAGDFNYIEFIANSKSGQFFFYSHDGR